MAKIPQCPDCRIRMDVGFIPDTTYGAVLHSHWHKGPPEQASFLGLPVGTKIDKADMKPITAWRCGRCGLLRFHAL